MDFKNAFNSLKRDKMLDTVFRKRGQIYNYTHSHLFLGDKVIQSQEGCQQGDPEGPALFSDTVQDLVNQMVSQYNVWYLDDGNLSDHYPTVLEDLIRIIASADEYGLSLEKTKCCLIFLGIWTESSKKRKNAFWRNLRRYQSRGSWTFGNFRVANGRKCSSSPVEQKNDWIAETLWSCYEIRRPLWFLPV